MKIYYNIVRLRIVIKIYLYGRFFIMELRKLDNNEHYVIISALIGLMDSITDYSKVSLDKFKEIVNKNGSVIDYTLSLSNDDIRFLFENLEEAWQEWKITKVPMTLRGYLDSKVKNGLDKHLNDEYLVRNNGINFLLSSINEQLNPWPLEDIKN